MSDSGKHPASGASTLPHPSPVPLVRGAVNKAKEGFARVCTTTVSISRSQRRHKQHTNESTDLVRGSRSGSLLEKDSIERLPPIINNAADAISRGRQARKAGDLSLARERYSDAAKILSRAERRVLAYAHTIRHIADMLLDQGNYADAQVLYEETLNIYRGHLGTKPLDLANTVRPYAQLHELMGNRQSALEYWVEARNLYSSLRLEVGVEECEAHILRQAE